MDKQREIQAIKAGLPKLACADDPDILHLMSLQRGAFISHTTLKHLIIASGAMLPLVSDTVAVLESREPVLVQTEEAKHYSLWDVKEQAPVRVTRSKRQLL
ncbi:hypothetical protein IFM89_032243 [Coptis chinensis]|uniref:Uncharacterized protein n=1 Tax=Coptis chinensis TaxID=261450 RepID=A0A835HZ74_9MAGN|nr:hypothetical protein IFM89_032243 [Coptis chinensis]